MKKMNFINDDEADKLCECSLSSLAGNDVPFLRGTDNDLSAVDLLLIHVVISC